MHTRMKDEKREGDGSEKNSEKQVEGKGTRAINFHVFYMCGTISAMCFGIIAKRSYTDDML